MPHICKWNIYISLQNLRIFKSFHFETTGTSVSIWNNFSNNLVDSKTLSHIFCHKILSRIFNSLDIARISKRKNLSRIFIWPDVPTPEYLSDLTYYTIHLPNSSQNLTSSDLSRLSNLKILFRISFQTTFHTLSSGKILCWIFPSTERPDGATCLWSGI